MSLFPNLHQAFQMSAEKWRQAGPRLFSIEARTRSARLGALALFFFVPFLAPHAAIAQAAQAQIRGRVTSASGKLLQSIRVVLVLNSSSGGRKIREATSGSDGSFEFNHLEPGSYTVRASCPSCALSPDMTLPLQSGQNMTVTLVVSEPAGAVPGKSALPSHSPNQPAGKKSSPALTQVGFDQKPAFKAAAISNPEAGGGYSNSASVGSDRMVREYLAPQRIGKVPGSMASDGRAIEQAAQSDPTEDHLNRWGNFLLHRRQYLHAAGVFGEAVKRYPRSESLRIGLGISLSSTGKYHEAAKQFAAATDLEPSDPEPYLFLGQAAILERSPDSEAMKRLRYFASAEPQNAQALYYYAMSLWADVPRSTGGPALSSIETLLKRASALDPALGQARLELGILYEQEGRENEALRAYQAAERATPDLAAAHYRLSQAYLRLGNKAAAQKEMELYRQSQQPSVPPDSR